MASFEIPNTGENLNRQESLYESDKEAGAFLKEFIETVLEKAGIDTPEKKLLFEGALFTFGGVGVVNAIMNMVGSFGPLSLEEFFMSGVLAEMGYVIMKNQLIAAGKTLDELVGKRRKEKNL